MGIRTLTCVFENRSMMVGFTSLCDDDDDDNDDRKIHCLRTVRQILLGWINQSGLDGRGI
jgi:hypothetical protein